MSEIDSNNPEYSESDGSEYKPDDERSSESEEISDCNQSEISDINLIINRKKVRKHTYSVPSTAKKLKTATPKPSSSRRPLLFTPAATSSSPAPGECEGIMIATPNQSRICADVSNDSRDTEFDSRLKAVESAIKEVGKNQYEILKLQKEMLSILKSNKHLKKDGKKTPMNISHAVRGAVRDGHDSGKEAKLEWTVSKENKCTPMKPNSEENRKMTEYICTFVKGIYPETADSVIEVATERYFQSLKEKHHREKKGQTAQFNNKMVYYQRRKRKLTKRRGAVAKKTTWSQELKEKVMDGLTIEMMSSEHEDESEGESVYVVRPLTWRSSEMDGYIKELDKKIQQSTTKSSKRQSAKRVVGEISSDRQCPTVAETNAWTIKQNLNGSTSINNDSP